MNGSSQIPVDNKKENFRILYLSLNPNLNGPVPKIDPLLISALTDLGCVVTKGTWGRHAEGETSIRKMLGRLGDILKALMILVRRRYDILYVATTLDEQALIRDLPLLLAVYCFPIKKVLIEHGSKLTLFTSKGDKIFKIMARLVIRLSDAILLLSNEELKSWIVFEPKGRYYRVDNPFDPNFTKKAPDIGALTRKSNGCPILLFAGRLIKPKGIYDLLDALPIILKHTECRLLVAGDGEEKEGIKNLLKKVDLNEHVSLLGYLDSDRLADVYKLASVFILPTYFGEGFPMVITEAMSFGLPIVTTPIRGVKDHLHDEVNALFVQPKDPETIANAVVRLLDDPNLRHEMSQANLAKVQEFKPENVAPKYLDIFFELLKDPKSNVMYQID